MLYINSTSSYLDVRKHPKHVFYCYRQYELRGKTGVRAEDMSPSPKPNHSIIMWQGEKELTWVPVFLSVKWKTLNVVGMKYYHTYKSPLQM